MTLKQLELFLAIADTRSFSKAGALASLAQSTVSQHIRALEEELQVRLFDRAATQVCLTEVGRLFYEHAAQICHQCGEAREAVRRFQGLEQATLRVGASTIPAAFLIPDMLGHFSAAWPGVRLELQQGDTREVLQLLRDEQVELAVVGGTSDDASISMQEIMAEQIFLVVRPELFSGPVIEQEQLLQLPLVIREPGSGTRTAVDAALQRSGLDPRTLRVVAQLGSTEAVRRAVLSGAGAAFVSSLAVGRELADGTLRALDLHGVEIRRSFYLAWRKGMSLSAPAQAFIDGLQQGSGMALGGSSVPVDIR